MPRTVIRSVFRNVFRTIAFYACALWLSGIPHTVLAQVPAASDASNRTLRVELDSTARVKLGSPLRGHTVEPLYEANQLVVPAGTVVLGRISAVTPATKGRRVSAMSHGDFTPLHEAAIQFETLRLRDGSIVPISASLAEQGSEVVRFRRSGATHMSLIKQAWAALMDRKKETLNTVTAPGKTDRLKKYVYSQLPVHPEIIDAGSQYDVTLLRPIGTAEPGQATFSLPLQTSKDKISESQMVHARLEKEITSKTNKQGDLVSAVVTQPVINPTGQIEIPQGSILRGRILRAHAASKWGKNGALRFTFNQVDFPQGTEQQVSGVPAAVDGAKNRNLKLDSEGGVEPDTNKGVMLPLALGLIATSAFLDEDSGMGHTVTASNGFGLITRVIVMATGSKYVAGSVGMIDAGRTVYSRFIAHGRDVVFSKNSQVEIEVGPTHKLAAQAN